MTKRVDKEAVEAALLDLVNRADGEEGIRADGSNIDTIRAHVALGDFDDVFDNCDGAENCSIGDY